MNDKNESKTGLQQNKVIIGIIVVLVLVVGVVGVVFATGQGSAKKDNIKVVDEAFTAISSSASQSDIDDTELSDDALGIVNKDELKKDTDSIASDIDNLLKDDTTYSISEKDFDLTALTR